MYCAKRKEGAATKKITNNGTGKSFWLETYCAVWHNEVNLRNRKSYKQLHHSTVFLHQTDQCRSEGTFKDVYKHMWEFKGTPAYHSVSCCNVLACHTGQPWYLCWCPCSFKNSHKKIWKCPDHDQAGNRTTWSAWRLFLGNVLLYSMFKSQVPLEVHFVSNTM